MLHKQLHVHPAPHPWADARALASAMGMSAPVLDLGEVVTLHRAEERGPADAETELCVTLALAAARAGRRVVIVDASGCSNADTALDARPRRPLSDAHSDVLGVIAWGEAGVGLVVCAAPIGRGVSERTFTRAIARLRLTFDLVIVDWGHARRDQLDIAARFARDADKVLITSVDAERAGDVTCALTFAGVAAVTLVHAQEGA